MTVHDELEAVLAAGRWEELRPYVLAPAGSDLHREASACYRARRTTWYEQHRWARPAEQDPAVDAPGALRALALAFLKPAPAARELGRLTYGWRRAPSDELGVAAALARGPEFCQPFLDAASHLTLSREEMWHVGWVARFGLPLVEAGMAHLPDGPAFGRGWAAMFQGYGGGGSLVEELRGTPVLAEGLAVAMATPDAFATFESIRRPGWELEVALAQLVAEGVLDRGPLLGSVLEALTRQDSAHSQRILARVLDALGFGPQDAVGRLPLLLHLLAVARGPVTAVLLPPVLAAAGDDDLPAVAATIFTRPEKAQRTTLLRALVADDAPWGREARVQALRAAAEVPDRALADRAARSLATLGAEPAPGPELSAVGLWTDPPPVDAADPATVVDPDEASLTAALSRMTVSMDASDGAMFWDAAVRWCAADPGAAMSWARSARRPTDDLTRVPAGLPALAPEPWERVSPASHRQLRVTTQQLHTGIRAHYDRDAYAVTSLSTTQALHRVLLSETTLRLGTIPCVVSTPTRTDGTLELTALAERLRKYAVDRSLVGPVDLFVALCRLEPVDPPRLHELDGLEVGLWSDDPGGGMQRLFRRRRPTDAVQLVRDWVVGGGLPPLDVGHRGGAVRIAPPVLPVPAEVFGGIPPSLLSGHEDGVHVEYADYAVSVEADAGVVPRWADLLAARLQRSFDQSGRFPPLMLPAMAASPRPGRAVVHAVTATLSHADEDRRLLAVDAALTLMGRGLWDPVDHTTCCEHLLGDGRLRLGRLAHSWEQLVLAGGLQLLWPTVTAVLGQACALERKPPGLAELLAMLRRYVAAVPDVVVPDSVTVLASSRSTSKARAEAAAFVEAATAGAAATAGSTAEEVAS